MTWGNPPKFQPDPLKRGKKITPEQLAASGSEDGHQAALFCWAADSVGTYPQLKWLFAIPNGGSRHIAEAAKLVAAGVRSGVPDLMLPYPIRSFAGLFMEMKIKNGNVTKEQEKWIEYLASVGYYTVVCWSWEEARDEILDYLNAA